MPITPIAPGERFAGYLVEEEVGRGGMGIVLRARQLSLDRVVALKVISPELAADEEFRRRFERESRLMASVTHPNVVAIHEAGEADGHLFVAMRWVDGTDLRRLIAQDGPLPPPFAADVVAQAAGALDALHDAGLVHRDVKPANILIEAGRGRPVAYLADFGLSMPVGSGVERLTRTGAWVGTVDYVAPEQIEDGPIDRRTDVYALGGVLYEALTGSVAFPRSSDSARLWAHLNEPPPSPRDIRKSVPAELGEVVRRALAKDPQRRWPTAGALGRAAVSAAGEDRARLTMSGPSMLIGEVPAGGSRARAAILTFVGIAVVALSAILLAGGTGGNSTTTQTGRALPTAAVHVERFSLGRNVAPGRRRRSTTRSTSSTATANRSSSSTRHRGSWSDGCTPVAGARRSSPTRRWRTTAHGSSLRARAMAVRRCARSIPGRAASRAGRSTFSPTRDSSPTLAARSRSCR